MSTNLPLEDSAAAAPVSSIAPRDPGRRRRSRGLAEFKRSLTYLRPYWKMVLTSIVCALFVGITTTAGLGAMLPIMRVLINGDRVQTWVYRQTAARRLGAYLVDDPEKVQVLSLRKLSSPAGDARWTGGEVLVEPGQTPPASLPDANARKQQSAALLKELATTDAPVVVEPVNGPPVTLTLPAAPIYLRWSMRLAEYLPEQPLWSVAAIFGLLVIATALGNVVRFFQEYLSDKAAILAVDDIRRHLYDHVLHLPLDRYGEQGSSDLTSRLVQDTANLQDGFKTVLGQSIQEPIKAAMAFGLAMLLSWKLTLFIIAFGPVMWLILKKFGKKMRRASRAALESSSDMLGQLEATLAGIRVVKAAGAERFERRRYTRIMTDLVHEQLRMSRIDAISAPTLETLTVIVAGVIVLYASYMVLVTHTLGTDVFILVMVSLVSIGESLRRTTKVLNALHKTNSAAARVFEAMDLPVERPRRRPTLAEIATVASPAGRKMFGRGRKLSPLQREICFENVVFSYPNATMRALDGVSLLVPRGRSIAVVGRNGSGKTTLLALLPRFFDPQSGRVLIDGIDVKSARLTDVRSQISIVTQESVIFPGTIAQNIAYGMPLATPQEIESAARRAFAHDFILDKPDGYNMMLGEMGGQLSGGQRQRLCIARAILRKSPILILDEATSQVDAESEHLIQKAVEGLMHERTTFVIAHRFSTILSADEIVVMDKGRIVGQGRHEDLLATCPTYMQLYERQLFAAPALRENVEQ